MTQEVNASEGRVKANATIETKAAEERVKANLTAGLQVYMTVYDAHIRISRA